MTEHTPTPWKVSSGSTHISPVGAAGGICKFESIHGMYTNYEANAAFIVKAVNYFPELIEALMPFAWYFDVNDCKDRSEDDALEVPIRDLRIAFELFEALGLAIKPIPDPVFGGSRMTYFHSPQETASE